MTPREVLVVGASAAGLATAEALRRRGFTGPLTLVGDERHLPYDRPPLSKQVLSGAWEPERARLRDAAALSTADVDIRLGDAAIGLDPANRSVRTAAGDLHTADTVVVATGVRPRRLPGTDGIAGVHVLRGLDDALALRTELTPGARLVVVGDGVLGAEVAATARTADVEVTLTGPGRAPMAAQLGPFGADRLAELHHANGVRLLLGAGATVEEVACTGGRVDGARLSSGDTLPADLVFVAIGATPATDWLSESGLSLDDGIRCDSRLRAAEGIHAVGDVARWHHEALGSPVRLENRTNATESGIHVAAGILGSDAPYVPVPYFWTDQFDVKIQVHGFLPPDADVSIVEGSPASGRFIAHHLVDGRVTGVLGWSMPKQTRQHRQAVVDALPGLHSAAG